MNEPRLLRCVATTRLILLSLLLFLGQVAIPSASSAEPQTVKNVAYKGEATLTELEQQRCRLDLYLPAEQPAFATLVWFHGGGMTGGTKDDASTVKIAQSLARAGVAVAAANYRLSPKATFPAYIEDAAAACAWVQKHIAEKGGDARRVFVGGHSAGGYLSAMLAMDARYFQRHGLAPTNFAGYIPVSGQLMTHYTVRAERGISRFNITADDAAPIRFARSDTAPLLVLYADKDMATRAEENRFFVSVLQAAGNKRVTELLVKDRNHGSVGNNIANDGDPARAAILDFIRTGSPATPPGK